MVGSGARLTKINQPLKAANDHLRAVGKSANTASNGIDKLHKKSSLATKSLLNMNRRLNEQKDTIRGLKSQLAATTAQVDKLTKANKRNSKSTQNLYERFLNLKNLIAGGIFAVAVKGAINLVDGYKNVNSLLKIVTTSTAQFTDVQSKLFDIAQSNYSSIADTTKLYAGQAKQLAALGFEQAKQLKVVDLFSKALATSGATTAEASAATLQWVQALGSGVLRGQEFNSIMENGRGVAIALADGLGVSIGQLRNMALEGKLSAKTVTNALLSQEQAIREKFGNVAITVGKAWAQLTNSATKGLSTLNTKLGDVTGGFAKSIQSISKYIDSLDFNNIAATISTMVDAVQLLAIAIGGKLVAALVLSTRTMLTNQIVLGRQAGLSATAAIATTALGGAVTGVGKAFKFFGGWIGLAITALVSLASYVKDLIGNQDKLSQKIKTAEGVQKSHSEVIEIATKLSAKYNKETKEGKLASESSIQGLVADTKAHALHNEELIKAAKAQTLLNLAQSQPLIATLTRTKIGSPEFDSEFAKIGDNLVTKKIKEFQEEIKKSEGTMERLNSILANLGKTAGGVADATGGLSEKQKNAADAMIQARSGISKALGKERFEIKANELALYEYNLNQVRVGKDKKRLSEEFIISSVAFKKETISLKLLNEARELSNKTYTESIASIALERKELELGFPLIKNLSVEKSREIADKTKLLDIDKKRIDQAKAANKTLEDLVSNNKLQTSLQESGLKLSLDEFKIYQKLEPIKKKSYQAELKSAKAIALQKKQTDAFNSDLKQLNFELRYNEILLTQGTSTAEKWADSIKYGSKKLSEQIKIKKDKLGFDEKELEQIGKLNDAFRGLMDGDNTRQFADHLIDAFAGDKINTAMDTFFDKISKGLSGNGFGKDGVFGGEGGFSSLFDTSGKKGSLIRNGATGAGLVSVFGGGQNQQIGGAIGGALAGTTAVTSAISSALGIATGSAAGAVAGSVIPVIGTIIGALLGSLVGPRPGRASFTQGGSAQGEFYNYKSPNDKFNRTTEFGRFGVSSDAFKIHRLGEEFLLGTKQTLDAMEDTDKLIQKITSEFDNKNIKQALQGQRTNGTDLSEFADQRLRLIAENLNPVLSSLINFDSKKPEELANRIGEIVQASQVGAPILESFGFNLNNALKDIGDSATFDASIIDQSASFDKQIKNKTTAIENLLSLPAVFGENKDGLFIDKVAMNERTNAVSLLKNEIKGLQDARNSLDSRTFAESEKERLEALREATTVALSDLAGGFDKVVSLYSNYTNKLLTAEERHVITRTNSLKAIDQFNDKAGLSGSATIQSAESLKFFIETLKTSGALVTEEGQKQYIAALQAVDAFAFVTGEINALTEAFTSIASPLSLINVETLTGRQNLVAYAGGLQNLNGLMSGYISNILTQDEQKIYAQVTAAQQLQELATDLGISASLLDTREEFKKVFADANSASALATETGQENLVKLLEASGAVATLADSGQSLVDVIKNAPADILSFSNGASTLSDQFSDVNTELNHAVDHSADIADNINNIIAPDFSNNLQRQLDAQKEANRLQQENNDIQKRNESKLQNLGDSFERLASNSSYESSRAG